ncbi:MAG: hypothetical protein E7262_01505 [Lachnospiraceae bacterium]|nr:hypothetical protein [Lachnospiraceae bacterium]
MKLNKKLVKITSLGLAAAIIAGTVVTQNLKANANEVVEYTSEVSAREYMEANIDNIANMSTEEAYEVFTDERFASEVNDLLVKQNKRGGGKSLSDKLKDLTDGQLDNLAGKLLDKLPQGIRDEIPTGATEEGDEVVDDTEVNTDEVTDDTTDVTEDDMELTEDSEEDDKESVGKSIIKSLLESIKDGMDAEEISKWLQDKFNFKPLLAKVVSTVTVGALDVIISLV